METKGFVIGLVRVFLFAFLGVFTPLVTGIALAPNYEAAKAAGIAALSAALAAGLKAVLDALTKGASPFPQTGVLPAEIKPQ